CGPDARRGRARLRLVGGESTRTQNGTQARMRPPTQANASGRRFVTLRHGSAKGYCMADRRRCTIDVRPLTSPPPLSRMVRVSRVVLLAAAASVAPAAAGAQIIRGVVLDAAERSPIRGATIELVGALRPEARARSDSTGAFTLEAPHAG